MTCRGVRGATTVEDDDRDAILSATRELLLAMVESNGIQPGDLAAIFFTCTPDLGAAFPAEAARNLGWSDVPLMDAQEMAVPGALPRCIRVLLLWNADCRPDQIRHVYLRGAGVLRPDLAAEPDTVPERRDAS